MQLNEKEEKVIRSAILHSFDDFMPTDTIPQQAKYDFVERAMANITNRAPENGPPRVQ